MFVCHLLTATKLWLEFWTSSAYHNTIVMPNDQLKKRIQNQSILIYFMHMFLLKTDYLYMKPLIWLWCQVITTYTTLMSVCVCYTTLICSCDIWSQLDNNRWHIWCRNKCTHIWNFDVFCHHRVWPHLKFRYFPCFYLKPTTLTTQNRCGLTIRCHSCTIILDNTLDAVHKQIQRS